MKRLMLIALSLILPLSACSPKAMTEEEKIRAVNEIFFKGIDTWQFACGSLEEGTYKIIFPVISYMTDNDGNEYKEDIELSAEFKIEK